jgi:tyrosyl-tRNA synthetase
MLSPYAFHQFWLNAEDEKVGELLRTFTFLPREEIEALEERHAAKPFLREAQKVLADEVTTIVHGAEETAQAKAAADALFGGGDITALSPSTLGAALSEAGAVDVDASGGIPGVVDLLTLTGLAASKGEARRTVGEGGVYINNVRVEDADHVPAGSDLIGGSWLVLRRGKKRFAGVRMI